ncbi:MAG: hypothetical protein ACQESF_01345 [Nanobdellota archaeon]
MVRYAENSLERVVNKLVFISIFFILVMVIMDILSFFLNSFQNPLSQVSVILGFMINLIFLVDLLLIFRKELTIASFFKNNWLDIIAVLPFDMFRLAKIARLSKLARFTRLTKETRLFRFIPRIFYLRGAKAFSKETDLNRQLERTRDRIFELKLKRKDSEMEKLYHKIKKITGV